VHYFIIFFIIIIILLLLCLKKMFSLQQTGNNNKIIKIIHEVTWEQNSETQQYYIHFLNELFYTTTVNC